MSGVGKSVTVLENHLVADQDAHPRRRESDRCAGRLPLAPSHGPRPHDAGSRTLSALYTALYMPSTRTQIYLTADQRRQLDARGRRTGAPLARMIREAVDGYLADDRPDTEEALDETFGTLPDLELPSREEWDRGTDPRR